MNATRFTFAGILLIVLIIFVFIAAARFLNPFDSGVGRILFSALFGGIGGALGATAAHKFGLTKPK